MQEYKSPFKVCAVDFDGTICYSQWPGLGEPNLPLIEKLLTWKKEGNKLILWTCRAGQQLDEAVEFCRQYGIEFDAVNDNLPELVEHYGNNSRKISCDIYIDDKNALPDEFAGCNKDREHRKVFSFLFNKTRKKKEKTKMRSIKELGFTEYLFQVFTTPTGWKWEYEFDSKTGELEMMLLLDENNSPIAVYEDFTLAIRGNTGIAKFDCDTSTRKMQHFILKWLSECEENPERSWSKEFRLYEYRRTLDQRAIRENATLLPHGWAWHTRIDDGYSWLESPKGKVVCEVDFENATFCYEKEWREIRHEDEIDFRKFIERKTRQKMRKSRFIG